jgi:hypothetical protein
MATGLDVEELTPTAQRGHRPRARVVLSVPVRPEQAEGLRALAEQSDLPCVTLVRQAIDLLLRERRVARP